MTTLRRSALIAALALIPVVPYMLLGYTGQDLPFHVCSWVELRDAWLTGRLNPGWSEAANYGRGDPHLSLYPPLSGLLGAALALVLPPRIVPAAFVWIALALAGLSMYAASKAFVAERDRVTAAVLYMLGPYTITTSLVRYAAAELLVMAWLPLVALCFYKAVWGARTEAPGGGTDRRALVLLALLLGLSWITNIPASIVLLYSLGAAAVVCSLLRQSALPLLRVVFAEALALALAAFHLLPVWTERSWVHPDTLLRIGTVQLLLFMPHYNFQDSPLLVVCWIFLCAQTALAAVCLRQRTLPLPADPAVPLWAALAAVAFLLESPLSIPLWQHAPELRFVQFPLRFLAVLGVAVPLLLLSRGTRHSLRRPAYILTGILSLAPFLGYLSEQAVAANRSPPLPELLARWRSMGAPEYLPAGTLMPVGPANLPAIQAIDRFNPLAADSRCRVEPERQDLALRVFRTSSVVPCRIRLTVYFYPFWRAADESGRPLPVLRDPTGFLLIDVPSGNHIVSLVFRPGSSARTGGAVLSLIALLLPAAWLLFNRGPAPNPPRTRVPVQIP
jgi:hypothetical protein